MSETNKYYCVKDYINGAGEKALTKGNIYKTSMWKFALTYDNGVIGSPYDTWEEYKRYQPSAAYLIPLVKRPAKVGEWVYLLNRGSSDYEIGKIYETRYTCDTAVPDGIYFGRDSKGYVRTDDYLVLDGYRPEQENDKINDRNQQYKYDADKPRLELVPPSLMIEVGKVLTYGAAKYSADSWRNVEAARYVGALLRHMMAYIQGEQMDPESGLRHLAHVACNASFLLELNNPVQDAKQGKPVVNDTHHAAQGETDKHSYDGEGRE